MSDRATTLPEGAKERKTYPIASGVLDYFPDAIAAIAHVSYVGNEQHNPGQPLHWAREKSTDQDDTLIRHFLERGKLDTDGLRHTAKLAWRALALLQLEIEGKQAATVAVTLASTSRNPDWGTRAVKRACPATHSMWRCERELGHYGDHMAWSDYENNVFYESGRWPNTDPKPQAMAPRPGGAF